MVIKIAEKEERITSLRQRILVTGGQGFIGGELVKSLAMRGHEVIAIARRDIVNQSSTRGDTCKYPILWIKHDLNEPIEFKKIGCVDAVIHAAARSSPWGKRSQFDRDNVTATQNVIDYCHATELPKLVFVSSSSVYYQPTDQIDIDERTPVAAIPINHYAATKQIAENIVRTYKGNWVIARPRAVFGPGDTVLLPRIVHAARSGRLPLLTSRKKVYGDLIYIESLVDYLTQFAESPTIVGEFNLTNGQPIVINEFIVEILEKLGIPLPKRKVPVGVAMMVAGGLELFHRIACPAIEPAITRFGVHVFAYSKTFNISKTLSMLGPPSVDLKTGLERTIADFRKGRGANDV